MVVTETISISRTPAIIFAYLTDVRNRKDYIPSLDKVILLDPLPLRLGSRYTEVARIAGRGFRTTYQIIEFLEGRRITAKTLKSVFPIQAQLELQDLGDKTELEITLQLQLKGVFKLASGIIGGIVKQQTLEILTKIKKNLEATEAV